MSVLTDIGDPYLLNGMNDNLMEMKRGRPRKMKTNNSENDINKEDKSVEITKTAFDVLNTVKVARRGRGRPRKFARQEFPVTIDDASRNFKTKRRGRPRKSTVSSFLNSQNLTDAVHNGTQQVILKSNQQRLLNFEKV